MRQLDPNRIGASDYKGSVGRIHQVCEQALRSLWREPEFKIPAEGDEADLDDGVDLWVTFPHHRTLGFSIGTQIGLFPTITITGRRASGYPSTEMRTREAVRQGLEVAVDGVITAYGAARGGEAYSELHAVRLVQARDLYLMPPEAWQERSIAVNSSEGNCFEYVTVADLRKAGKPVWEWTPASGWGR